MGWKELEQRKIEWNGMEAEISSHADLCYQALGYKSGHEGLYHNWQFLTIFFGPARNGA